MAAQTIPNPIQGRNSSQQNDVAINANDSDNKIFPYNGCRGFGRKIAIYGKSPTATVNSSDVQVMAKNNKTQPINRSPHDCNFLS